MTLTFLILGYRDFPEDQNTDKGGNDANQIIPAYFINPNSEYSPPNKLRRIDKDRSNQSQELQPQDNRYTKLSIYGSQVGSECVEHVILRTNSHG